MILNNKSKYYVIEPFSTEEFKFLYFLKNWLAYQIIKGKLTELHYNLLKEKILKFDNNSNRK
jgi:hypothetical protein